MEEKINLKVLEDKIKLIKEKSPLYKLNFDVPKMNLFMKREDLIDFGVGGNKVRLLEYIVYDAIKKGATKLITFGSIHSNHVRITALVAHILNLECDIIILEEDEIHEEIEGNMFLLDVYESNVSYCKLKNATEYIDKYLETQKQMNINYYFIPGGGHTGEGALGYINCLLEIEEQCKDLKVNIDAIVLPTGTGTCQAGLIFANRLLNLNIKIVGISIARKQKRCIEEIKKILQDLNEKFKINFNWNDTDIIVVDKFLDKYGEVNEEELKNTKKLIRSDGIFLDPIYNSKAFTGFINLKSEESLGKNVLYINTGGLPNIFNKSFIKRMINR